MRMRARKRRRKSKPRQEKTLWTTRDIAEARRELRKAAAAIEETVTGKPWAKDDWHG
jgi:hypothetical protein